MKALCATSFALALPLIASACGTGPKPISIEARHYASHTERTGLTRYRVEADEIMPQNGAVLVRVRLQGAAERLTWQEYRIVETYHRSPVFLWEHAPKATSVDWVADPHRPGYSERYSINDVPREQRKPVSREMIDIATNNESYTVRWSIRELVDRDIEPNSGASSLRAGGMDLRVAGEVLANAALLGQSITIEIRCDEAGIDNASLTVDHAVIQQAKRR